MALKSAVKLRQAPIEPLAISVDDCNAVCGWGRTTTYKLIGRGKLKKIKVLGRTLITVASLKAFIAEAVDEAGAAK